MQTCRHKTLALFDIVTPDIFVCQIHPEFSPVGWHLGHIAYTEALWILEKSYGITPPPCPGSTRLFRADGLGKADRCQLPDFASILDYLQAVRQQSVAFIRSYAGANTDRLLWWLLQHECQHSETIAILLHLAGVYPHNLALTIPEEKQALDRTSSMLKIPKGGFWQGSNHLWAQDNERPVHWIELDSYRLDPQPVTRGNYQHFIASGGYLTPDYWSDEGWQWRQQNQIRLPLYWSVSGCGEDHPVYGVSAYEAEAYANFLGKRLPTEAEWENAARRQSLVHPKIPGGKDDVGLSNFLGNVWEWTASTFSPYDGFEPYPYAGYSQVYFDGQHRVLRGGSWATQPWGLRSSFRNWYHPWVREIFAGFRCASS